ncbi:MAG: hypothetical protein GEU80_09425 [Dehalococcoidia bacterium]|nr:hypothetical protein [Dehalococcoidia bacterium]
MRFTTAHLGSLLLAATCLLAACGDDAESVDVALQSWAVRVCTESDALHTDLVQLREDFEVDTTTPPGATEEQALRIRQQTAADTLNTLVSLRERYVAVIEGLNAPAELAPYQDQLLADGRGALERTRSALTAVNDSASAEAVQSLVAGVRSGAEDLLDPPSPPLPDEARAVLEAARPCGALAE